MRMMKVIGKGLSGLGTSSEKFALMSLEKDIKRLDLKKFYFKAGIPHNISLKIFKKKVKDLFKKHNKNLVSFTTIRKDKGYIMCIYKPYKKEKEYLVTKRGGVGWIISKKGVKGSINAKSEKKKK